MSAATAPAKGSPMSTNGKGPSARGPGGAPPGPGGDAEADRAFPELPPWLGTPPPAEAAKVREHLWWWADQFAGAGLPTEHTPRDRPLEPERAAEGWHTGLQHRTVQWAARARKAIEARRSLVATREAHLAEIARSLDEQREEVEAHLREHETAIAGSEPGRQYEWQRSMWRVLSLLGPLVLLVPEYSVVAPALGQMQNLGGDQLFRAVVFLSLTQILLAELTGSRARHWVESVKPRPARRVEALLVGLCTGLLVVSQVAIAFMRWGADEDRTGSGLALTLGTQFTVVALSVAIGWFHAEPPEVRSRRAVADELDRLTTDWDQALELAAAARNEVEVLDGLITGWPAWTRGRQAEVREVYDAELQLFRARLRIGLEKRDLHEPAYHLSTTVPPVLDIPLDTVGLDEDDDLIDGATPLDLTL